MFTINKFTESGTPIPYTCNVGCVEVYKPHLFPIKEYWLCVAVGWDSSTQDFIYWGITTEQRRDITPVTENNWATFYIDGKVAKKFYYYGPDELVKLSSIKNSKPFGRIHNLVALYNMMREYKYELYFDKPTYTDGLIYYIDPDKELYFMPINTYHKIDSSKGLFIDGKEHYHIYKGYTKFSKLVPENIHSRFTWDSYLTMMGIYHNAIECFSDNGFLDSRPLKNHKMCGNDIGVGMWQQHDS